MSYPSIEAYEISPLIDGSYNICACLGSDAKQIISQHADQIAMNKINEHSILHACREFKNTYQIRESILILTISQVLIYIFLIRKKHIMRKIVRIFYFP